MKLVAVLLLLVGMLVPGSSLAAAGDDVSGATVNEGSTRITKAIYVCDGAASCLSEKDLRDIPGGQPDQIIFEENATTGCSGTPSLSIKTNTVTSGTTHEIDTSAVTLGGATTRVVWSLDDASSDRYLTFAASSTSGCTDYEVFMLYVVERPS